MIETPLSETSAEPVSVRDKQSTILPGLVEH